MEPERTYKRRSILIRQPFQMKYVGVISALFALSALLIWWETYHNMNELLKQPMLTDAASIATLRQTANVILFKLLVTQALVFLIAILITHFVAGPLYRLERNYAQIKDGDLTHRIQFRKFDQLISLANAHNNATAAIQDRIRHDRETVSTVARDIEQAASQGQLPREQAAAITDKLKTVTSEFTI